MTRQTHKLSVDFIAAIDKPGRYGDGGGLELQVSKWVTKSWLFRYMRAGKTSWMGLGAFPAVGLTDAREKVAEARRELSRGADPLTTKRMTSANTQKARRSAVRQIEQERRASKKLARRRAMERAAYDALKELKILEE